MPAAPRVVFVELVASSLRNLRDIEFEPGPALNVLAGDNGQGKTSVLEALYLCATTRSFRTARLADIVSHGSARGSVRASLEEHPSGDGNVPRPLVRRQQSVGIEGATRTVRLDGEPPTSLAHFATRTPVVVFHPGELELSTGGPVARRELLDRVALFQHPDTNHHRSRYGRALRERRRLLSVHADPKELLAYEQLLAEHGAALTNRRARAAAHLCEEACVLFGRIAAPGLELELRYQPGGSADAAVAHATLATGRARDAARGTAGFGPHLDDLVLSLDGRRARVVASQGQHRTVTMALKLAELRCIAAARQLQPVLLLDDVSSELDRDRARALLSELGGASGQVFLTTARPDLLGELRPPATRTFLVTAGALARAD